MIVKSLPFLVGLANVPLGAFQLHLGGWHNWVALVSFTSVAFCWYVGICVVLERDLMPPWKRW